MCRPDAQPPLRPSASALHTCQPPGSEPGRMFPQPPWPRAVACHWTLVPEGGRPPRSALGLPSASSQPPGAAAPSQCPECPNGPHPACHWSPKPGRVLKKHSAGGTQEQGARVSGRSYRSSCSLSGLLPRYCSLSCLEASRGLSGLRGPEQTPWDPGCQGFHRLPSTASCRPRPAGL